MSYPSGIQIYVDGKNCTYYITGSNTFDPTVDLNTFRDIDIGPYLRKTPGIHTVEITAQDGNGRAEVRVEIR